VAGRYALIVATGDYVDPKLLDLRSPEIDADGLAKVLGDPAKGAFEVDIAKNEDERDLRRRLAVFFSNRGRDDLLFLHFSCHGIKDEAGELYLAATDTEKDVLSATGISARWLNEQIARTRSARVLVLLDCCYSGSFPSGMQARADDSVNVDDHLGGRGRAVITASTSTEYAWEGNDRKGEGRPSVFTGAVVDALETGKADRDQDRRIEVTELYHYVYDQVTELNPNQEPGIANDLRGPFYIAKSSYEATVEPAELDEHLISLTANPLAGARLGAVDELSKLLRSPDRAVVLAAREALERMVKDDSRRVSAAAQAVRNQWEPPAPAQTAEAGVTSNRAPEESVGRRLDHREPLRGTDLRQRDLTVRNLAFSPDGRLLVLTGERRSDKRAAIRIVDVESGAQRLDLDAAGWVSDVAFTPDCRMVAAAFEYEGDDDRGTARVWDVASAKELLVLDLPHFFTTIAFSPDGTLLATGATYGGSMAPRIWSVASGDQLLALKRRSGSNALAFSPDGRLLAIGSEDKTARLWEVDSGKEVLALKHSGTWAAVQSVAFSPDGLLLATASNGVGRIWKVANGMELFALKPERVSSVAFSPDGALLATGGVDGDSGAARTWEVDTGVELRTMKHPYPVYSVAFSPSGNLLTTCMRIEEDEEEVETWALEARVWNVDSGNEALVLRHPST
jgi:sugar lactone lactonase YvrE